MPGKKRPRRQSRHKHPYSHTRIGHDLGATGSQGKSGIDGGRVPVSTARLTRHAGVQGRRRVGGAATDSPSCFSSLWAPGASRPKMAGGAPRWHPAHGRPILQRPGGKLCAAYAAGWRILLLRVRFGPQKLNQLRRFCFTSGDRTPPGPCVPHGGMPAALLSSSRECVCEREVY